MKRFLLWVSVALASVGLGGVLLQHKLFWPPPAIGRLPVEVLPQGGDWTAEKRATFHHLTQGTQIMPLAWFKALKRPTLLPTDEKLSDADYLRRFGFLDSDAPDELSHGLPIGFAVDDKFVDPMTGERREVVGFTCAACHTGELRFKGKAYRIEGGAAMTDLTEFRRAIGTAMTFTALLPGRFDDFAEQVLPKLEPEIREVAKLELRRQLEVATISAFRRNRQEVAGPKSHKGENSLEGFGRLAALERISNTVFGDQLSAANVRGIEAPTAYPHIWDTHWFDWVQYNASIHQPLARNIGEAIGVNAPIQLRLPQTKFLSTVKIENLIALERQLAGAAPGQGLAAPAWPVDFGPVQGTDPNKRGDVANGAKLYGDKCARCHGTVEDWQPGSPRWKPWTYQNEDKTVTKTVHLYSVPTLPVGRVGTDPALAVGFARASVVGLDRTRALPATEALTLAIDGASNLEFDARGLSEEEKAEKQSWRHNSIRAVVPYGRERRPYPSYKARPLNGVWATPPYLHNGSVRTLYELLTPAAEREKSFRMGTREFDVDDVGYESGGPFELDTRLPGNCNLGHDFTDEAPVGCTDDPMLERNGKEISPDDRRDLIAFLRTL